MIDMELILNQDLDMDMILQDAKPRGIIEVGAWRGNSWSLYDKWGVKNRCWIEANPVTYQQLRANVPLEDVTINVAVCDQDSEFPFMITNNDGQSSSLLPFKRHAEVYTTVFVTSTVMVRGRRLDTLVEEHLIDMSQYNFLFMDLQGTEYLALRGFEKNIHKIDYIVAEINYEELYAGCMLVDDFDKYLSDRGFIKVIATKHETVGWGDGYYKRVR
jgi:FkbM family methyltransferase